MKAVKRKKNPSEVARLGGLKGGPARANALTRKERVAIAKKAGKAGGEARAKKISARRRSEIARKAAAARFPKKRRKATKKLQKPQDKALPQRSTAPTKLLKSFPRYPHP